MRLLVRGDTIPDEVTLRVWRGHEERLPMLPLADGTYEASLPAGDTPMLVWYRFEVTTGGRHIVYGNAYDNLGGVGCEGNEDSYQLTVYDPAFDPPHWLREGVMYQIMVDRFYDGDPTNSLFFARQDIHRHADWYEPPALTLTDQGDNLANDFYGGNLAGIRAKLPYLASLGITVLYLNPIFRANSNHKYDTGDYEHIDPMFGDNAAFTALCAEAGSLGIRVMLDGVFSHVGADSRYFNSRDTYPGLGAWQSTKSPYYSWFTFHEFPHTYECWWGFKTLPNVREEEPSYVDYMLTGPQAIVPGWIQRGASAWRLDVADELPMPFLRTLRQSVKAAQADAVVLGEVWEDASNKVTYGSLRSYVLGDTLDSVMNYPLREALIGFLLGHIDAEMIKRRLDALAENYPKPFFYSLMNLLGSHDRARILNVLAENDGESMSREERRALALSPDQRSVGQRRVRLMLRMIAALPGMPCVYYGDETGMEGAADPFCRATYPWGQEDEEQLEFFRTELLRRRQTPALTRGEYALFAPHPDVLVVVRSIRNGKDAFGQNVPVENDTVLCAINRANAPRKVQLPAALLGESEDIVLTLGALDSVILQGH